MESSRHTGARRLLFLLLAGTFLLAAAPAAQAQAASTYVDPYVDPYVGTSPVVGTSAGGVGRLSPPMSQGSAGAAISVTKAGLGDPPPALDEGDRRLVTGWDLVTLAALGSGVVAFAVSAGRFRSS